MIPPNKDGRPVCLAERPVDVQVVVDEGYCAIT
jgi:hypothetical protein